MQRGERRTEGDVASLAFSLHRNAPGALLEALAAVADLGLNMSRIESRPSKRELGEYVFFLDVDLPSGGGALLQQLTKRLAPLCEHLAQFVPTRVLSCRKTEAFRGHEVGRVSSDPRLRTAG